MIVSIKEGSVEKDLLNLLNSLIEVDYIFMHQQNSLNKLVQDSGEEIKIYRCNNYHSEV